MENLKNIGVKLYQDGVFRCIFGREGMEYYLIGLLNAIFFQFELPLIKKLAIKNPYQLPRNENQKTSILDVFVEDEKGRKIDVEMQTRNQKFFNKRLIYYAAQNFVDQIHEGEPYGELCSSFVIAFVRFPIPGRPADCWIDLQQLTSSRYPELKSDEISIFYVRIPDKPGMIVPESVCQELRDWISYIGSDVMPEEVVQEIKGRNATIKGFDEEVGRFTLTEDALMALTREQMYEIDRAEQTQFMIDAAIQGVMEKGMEEGKKEGKKEGVVQGRIDSIEQLLRTRFPNEFVTRRQPLNSKLYEKPLPVLESLLPLSVSCASLSEFMQKL